MQPLRTLLRYPSTDLTLGGALLSIPFLYQTRNASKSDALTAGPSDPPLYLGAFSVPSFHGSLDNNYSPESLEPSMVYVIHDRDWPAPITTLAADDSVDNDTNTLRYQRKFVYTQIGITKDRSHNIWHTWQHNITWPDLDELTNLRFEFQFQPCDRLGCVDVARSDNTASSYIDTYDGQRWITMQITMPLYWRSYGNWANRPGWHFNTTTAFLEESSYDMPTALEMREHGGFLARIAPYEPWTRSVDGYLAFRIAHL